MQEVKKKEEREGVREKQKGGSRKLESRKNRDTWAQEGFMDPM